jgi:hypothetical protein
MQGWGRRWSLSNNRQAWPPRGCLRESELEEAKKTTDLAPGPSPGKRENREFRLVEEAASPAGTCDQLDVPLALALHELHIVARFRPVDARAPRARALDLYVGQGLILK